MFKIFFEHPRNERVDNFAEFGSLVLKNTKERKDLLDNPWIQDSLPRGKIWSFDFLGIHAMCRSREALSSTTSTLSWKESELTGVVG